MAISILYDHRSSICSQMARLALEEKGVPYRRRQIDIMVTSEQFEPWYVALNPTAVVPTLDMNGEVVTDTVRIVNRINELDGPDLSGNETTQDWLRDIMSLHYGVLMYSNRSKDGSVAPEIVKRGKNLEALTKSRPDHLPLISARLERNKKFQKILQDPDAIAQHYAATRSLVDRMVSSVSESKFMAGDTYSLADCFATAALARFRVHNLSEWWADTPLEAYYSAMKGRPSFIAGDVIDVGTERDL